MWNVSIAGQAAYIHANEYDLFVIYGERERVPIVGLPH